MNDLKFHKQFTQVIQDRLIDGVGTLASAKHQKDKGLAGNTQVMIRRLTVPKREVRAKRVADLINWFLKVLLRVICGDSNGICKPGKRSERHPWFNIRHIQQRRNREPCNCHRHSHITTSKEHYVWLELIQNTACGQNTAAKHGEVPWQISQTNTMQAGSRDAAEGNTLAFHQ